jgi:hypothetical protein
MDTYRYLLPMDSILYMHVPVKFFFFFERCTGQVVSFCNYRTAFGLYSMYARTGQVISFSITDILSPFRNIRCFSFVKLMYLDTF